MKGDKLPQVLKESPNPTAEQEQVMPEKAESNLASLCGMVTATRSASLEEMKRAWGDAVAGKLAEQNTHR